jgi:hypothetical protein
MESVATTATPATRRVERDLERGDSRRFQRAVTLEGVFERV